MSVTRPSAVRTIVRGLSIRCPACGVGHVFRRGIESAAACAACGWRLDRCPGHWVGGNEINLLFAFAAGVTVYALSALAFGLGTASVSLATAATGVSSLALYRTSRGVFLALDYLIDPTADSFVPPPSDLDRGPDRGPDRGVPPRVGPRDPGGATRAPSPGGPALPCAPPFSPTLPPAGSAESFIPPPATPYPPPATVSP
jgi:uncharacterized protein (DUF983 family)